MNLYFIKCLMFTKNNNIKTKRRINRKINLCSYFFGYGFKKFASINEEEISD